MRGAHSPGICLLRTLSVTHTHTHTHTRVHTAQGYGALSNVSEQMLYVKDLSTAQFCLRPVSISASWQVKGDGS